MSDADYKNFMGMLSLCPKVEVISTSSVKMTDEMAEHCLNCAISELRHENVFRYPSDYTYIMMALNEKPVKGVPFFYSPNEFLEYLKALGFNALPGRSTLYDCKQKMVGRFPEWVFNDNPRPVETGRRINVAKRFLNAFRRAMNEFSDGLSDN